MPSKFANFEPCKLFSNFIPRLAEPRLGINHPVTVAVQFFRQSKMNLPILRNYAQNQVSICSRLLGPYHPETLTTRLSFDAMVRMHQSGQEHLLHQVCSSAEQKFGEHHHVTLGVIHDHAGFQLPALHNTATAEALFRELHRRATHANDTMFILMAVVGFALAADRRHMYDESLALFQQGIGLSTEIVGRDHWYTQSLLSWCEYVRISQIAQQLHK